MIKIYTNLIDVGTVLSNLKKKKWSLHVNTDTNSVIWMNYSNLGFRCLLAFKSEKSPGHDGILIFFP